MTVPIGGTAESAIILRDNSPEALRRARELWDKHSGAPGLLDGRGYTFNPVTSRYRRKNGLYVSQAQLRTYVRNTSQAAADEMKKNTQQLIAGIIMLAVWRERMQSLMAALYRAIWVLSIGGFLFEDDTQRNLFYLFVLSQFGWLDNMYSQINTRVQVLDGRAMSRAGMYGDFGNGMWQNVQLERQINLGRREAKRILGENENHCHDDDERPGCVELAALGWIPIHEMIPIGDAVCYSKCHCRIIYR